MVRYQAQNERKGPSGKAQCGSLHEAVLHILGLEQQLWLACYHVARLLWQHQTNEWTTSQRQGGE